MAVKVVSPNVAAVSDPAPPVLTAAPKEIEANKAITEGPMPQAAAIAAFEVVESTATSVKSPTQVPTTANAKGAAEARVRQLRHHFGRLLMCFSALWHLTREASGGCNPKLGADMRQRQRHFTSATLCLVTSSGGAPSSLRTTSTQTPSVWCTLLSACCVCFFCWVLIGA